MWKCPCEICWYKCSVHRHSIQQETIIDCSNFKNHKRKSIITKEARKASRAAKQPSTFEAMMADDLRIAELKALRREPIKRMRDIPLGKSQLRYVRPRLLGPVLRRRFSGNAPTK